MWAAGFRRDKMGAMKAYRDGANTTSPTSASSVAAALRWSQ